MLKEYDCKLIFEDGLEIKGYSFGAWQEKVCEIVFNTSMVGYQEILSDPSYTYQAVVMTYPLIGNYGMAADDYETIYPTIGAFVVGEYNDLPSNFRSITSLDGIMKKHNIPGISGIDTRKLTRYIRDNGSQKVLLASIDKKTEDGVKLLKESIIPTDAVSKVTRPAMCQANIMDPKYKVVAIDCGMKENIVRSLNRRGCSVTIVPYNTSAEFIAVSYTHLTLPTKA